MSMALASCTDLTLQEMTGSQPDPDEFNAAPVFSMKAEQVPGNIWDLTFTYGGGTSARNVTIKGTKPAENSFTVDLDSADEEFVSEYSEKTGTAYKLLPRGFYKFSGGDYIDIPKGSQESSPNTLTVYARNLLGNVLDPGRYLLPVVASSATEELKDTLLVVDITVREQWTDPDGYSLYEGEDMFTVFYLNTTQFDPRLANDMFLYDYRETDINNKYRGLGNIVNLRIASVGYDEATGRVSVKPSQDLKYVLEHYTECVLPVQESGRKVCICIEGGGKGIGFCNFTDSQISDFTASVKRMVDTYGLDGINLWDRNSGYDKAVESGFPEMNTTSYPKLIKALREALGSERLLTVTDYEKPTEYFWDTDATGEVEVGRYIDYAWSGYCSGDEPVQIVDPWHQGQPDVSSRYPRNPIAGLDASRYGCIHATIYPDDIQAETEPVTEWVKAGLNQSGITVYYDIRSMIQDRFESGGHWSPDFILKAWFDDLSLQIDTDRLSNKPGFPGYNHTLYDKWVKYW